MKLESEPAPTPRVTATLDRFRLAAGVLALRLREGAGTMNKALDAGGAREAVRLAGELDDLADVLRDGLPNDTEARALRRAQVAGRLLEINRCAEELLARASRTPPPRPA